MRKPERRDDRRRLFWKGSGTGGAEPGERPASGDRERARYCRRQVIAAKDRAKFLAENPRTSPARMVEKAEMAQWMLVWLENPEVFPAWVEARKVILATNESNTA